jgi:hypothetical protein
MSARKKDYFTADEQKFMLAGYRSGRLPSAVAQDLNCAAKTMQRQFQRFRAEGIPRDRAVRVYEAPRHIGPRVVEQKPKPSPAERKAARHYSSNFEL